jgi:putative IMPACT (imprinted ancient) family translation regulator
VAVVVTRWLGGVLLGTGGLVRAYGGTAAACLRVANLIITSGRASMSMSHKPPSYHEPTGLWR